VLPAGAPSPGGAGKASDLERIFTAYLGTVPEPDAVVQLLNFVTEVQALPAERQAIIQRALDGDPSLLAQAVAQQPNTPVATQARPAPATGWDDDDTPPADPRVDELQARLDRYEAERQEEQKRQYDQWAAYEAEATKQAAVGYAGAKGLDQADLAILEAQAHRLGNYGTLLRSHNNDPAAAYTAALDVAYWSTPAFRNRDLAQQATRDTSRDAEDEERKVLASAVSASSAAGTGIAPPAGPKDMAGAKAAALAEVRQAFDIG
jgi:hypothetical protein